MSGSAKPLIIGHMSPVVCSPNSQIYRASAHGCKCGWCRSCSFDPGFILGCWHPATQPERAHTSRACHPRRRSWAHEQLGHRERAAADQMVIAELGADVSAEQRAKSVELLAKMRRRMPAGALQTAR